ncbi:MAG: hypothetical protein ACREU6_03755 [Steroidobacteraceae bacterium]
MAIGSMGDALTCIAFGAEWKIEQMQSSDPHVHPPEFKSVR